MKTLTLIALLASIPSLADDCYTRMPGTGEAKKAESSDCLAPKPFTVVGGSMTSMSIFSHEIEMGSKDSPKNMFTQYIGKWNLVKPAKETEEWKDRLKAVADKNGFAASIEDTKKLVETASLKEVKTRMELDQVMQRRCLLFTASSACAKVPVNELVSCKGKANEIVARVTDSKQLTTTEQGEIILGVMKDMGYAELSQKLSEKSLNLVKKYIPYVGKGVDYAYKGMELWDQYKTAKQVAADTKAAKDSGAGDVTWAKAFDKAMKDRESEHLCYPGEIQFKKKVEMILGTVAGQAKNEKSKKDGGKAGASSSSAASADDDSNGLLPFGIGKGKKAD